VALFHWTPAATRFEWGGTAPGGLATIDEVRNAILSGAIKDRPGSGSAKSEGIVRSQQASGEPPPLWVCPKCGARLVSRNLWHSCGRFTLEALFDDARPGVLGLARHYVRMLQSLGDVQVIPQKTRLVCVARVRFAGLYPRKSGFLAGFALRRRLSSPRIVRITDYDARWRAHLVDVRSDDDLDNELRTWLQEAHDTVGLQDDLY
jgi:hypothetical protein